MDRKREKEGGRMQCFMKKEDKNLIDVENVETMYRRNVLPSELTNTIEQFIVCVHWSRYMLYQMLLIAVLPNNLYLFCSIILCV